MALTGGDEIQIHQENDDHNDDHNDNDGNDQDTTRTAAATGGAAGGQGTNTSTSGWSKTRSQNSLDQKARIAFQLRISSGNWRILPKQTGGWMLKSTTTSPTHSGIRLENGSLQWSTGMTMNTINPFGLISKRFSNRNTQFKPTRG